MKVINPGLPEPYCYESDYRKIPREYLNPRIPEGRLNVKWQPFKTMPAQYEMLDQHIEDQNKIDMPLLSEDQLEEIDNKLNYKLHNNIVANIDYYNDGYIYSIHGYIKKVDLLKREIVIVSNKKNEYKHISLNAVCNLD